MVPARMYAKVDLYRVVNRTRLSHSTFSAFLWFDDTISLIKPSRVGTAREVLRRPGKIIMESD